MIKQKNINLHKQPVDILAVSNAVITLLSPLAVKKNTHIVNLIPEDAPLVLADCNRLQQILHNLIGNAIKFTENGSITIGVRAIDEIVEVFIADSGIGVPVEHQKNIFKPFVQADGTGRGLSITKKLIELHDGNIWLISTPYIGSTFFFTLPISKTDLEKKLPEKQINNILYDQRSEKQDRRKTIKNQRTAFIDRREQIIPIDFKGIKILAVDDEKVNLKVLENILTFTGAQVETANSGIKALEVMSSFMPDIILLDIMMPKMNGYEIARQIRTKYDKIDLPIIFISARNQMSDIVDTFLIGGNDYIGKPISKNELIMRISFHVDLLKSRRELMKTKKKYQDMFDNSIEGIFQITPSGEFITFNPALVKFFGCDSDEDFRNSIRPVNVFSNNENMKAFVQILKNKGFITEFESQAVKKDKTIFYLSATTRAVYNTNGKLLYYEGSVIDITDRKQREISEKEKEIAKASEKAKGDFLSHMSHEIRTPMNAIIGLSDLCLLTNLNHKQKDYIEKIQSSAQLLLYLINDILDFSKIEAEKLELAAIDFNILDVLQNISNIISLKAHEKRIELLFDIAHDIPLDLIGDPLRLEQILINLFNNAIKFTDTGYIVLTIKRLENNDLVNNHLTLTFTVEDTGIGMSEEAIKRLFKSFSQADATTAHRYGGTGLGLAISKKLVELMGGSINVTSEEGKGTTFTFSIPFNVKEGHIAKQFIFPSDMKKIWILILDDKEKSRKVLAKILSSFSFETKFAATEQEAFEILNNHTYQNPFDLLIVDFNLENASGIDAIKNIKRDSRYSNIPVVLMITFYDDMSMTQNTKAAGINSLLLKPINSSTLFNAVNDIFGKVYYAKPQTVSNSPLTHKKEDIKKIKGAKILVVEDNKVNQQIFKELLENIGFLTEIANHGKEAVEFVCKDNNYKELDAILMDVEMPQLDGYLATKYIRKWEDKSNKPQENNCIPIIAITANAMIGEKEKCLKTGMNDYVSKPINPKKLIDALIAWIKPDEKYAARLKTIEKPTKYEQNKDNIGLPASLPGIDIVSALNRMGGNSRLYKQLLQDFRDEYANIKAEIIQGVEAKQYQTLKRLIHSFKGESGNLGAKALFETIKKLEENFKNNPHIKEEILNLLSKELNQVFESIAILCNNDETTIPSTLEPLDESNIKSLFHKLSELVSEYDPGAVDHFYQLKSVFKNERVKDHMKKLEKQLGNFEFEEAKELLEEIIGKLYE